MLEGTGFKSMGDVDPCLFISYKCILMIYVDYTFFFSPEEKYINGAIKKLSYAELELQI